MLKVRGSTEPQFNHTFLLRSRWIVVASCTRFRGRAPCNERTDLRRVLPSKNTLTTFVVFMMGIPMLMKRLTSIAMLLVVCALAAGGYYWMHLPPRVTAAERPPAKPDRENVQLTEAKMAEAAITIAAVEQHSMQPIRTVPGRIEYNETRHVAVKSPSDGLTHKIAVKVGERIKEGQLLAVVNSPDLGERRSDVLHQEAELQLAQRERDWWRLIQQNLDELLSQLKRPQEVEVLEKEFRDRVLGDYRDIISAYSKFRTAEAINSNLKSVANGTITQRMLLEQASARDAASASFQSACEQATFDVRQKVGKAEAMYNDASRRLAVARQRLTWLTGQTPEQFGDLSNEETLSIWPVVAPFAATVEEIVVAATERVRQGEELLLLADTSKLWVQAEIRDKDWSALKLKAGQKVQVQSPALPNQSLEATISFIGREVNPELRAMPLVAEIQNEDGLLKPGMFVRVLLPDGAAIKTTAIPDSAVVRHEGRVFVFVETGPRQFTPRDITLGLAVDPIVEVKSGLQAGERIAVSGTFLLKSELLLEPEDE